MALKRIRIVLMHSPKYAAAQYQCQDSLTPDGSDNKVRRVWVRPWSTHLGSGFVRSVAPGFRGSGIFCARSLLLLIILV